MSSQEFFRQAKSHLTEGGIMVVNMNMKSGQSGSINEYLTDTICSVFGSASTVDVPGYTNRVLYASDDASYLDRFEQNISQISDADLKTLMQAALEKQNTCHPGDHILTDDRAPVELLGMRAIDELIAEELSYYKLLLKEQGIEGLIGAL